MKKYLKHLKLYWIWYSLIISTVLVSTLYLITINNKDEKWDEITSWVYDIDAHVRYSIRIKNIEDDNISKKTADSIENSIKDDWVEINSLLSNKEEYISDDGLSIWEINKSSVGVELSVNSHVYNVLTIAEELYDLTQGAFDITQGNLIYEWEKLTNEHEGALYDAIDLGGAQSGYDYIQENNFINEFSFNESIELLGNNKIKIKEPININLGGIAKAYIVDYAYDVLDKHFSNYMVNSLGSSIRFKGDVPVASGVNKYVSITNPVDKYNGCIINCGYYVGIYADNKAISTSGDYETGNSITINNDRYHHIINPKTGMPSNYKVDNGEVRLDDDFAVRTITEVGDSAAIIDGLTTAYLINGKDWSLNFAESNQKVIVGATLINNQLEIFNSTFANDLLVEL